MVKLSRAQIGRARGVHTTVKSATGKARAFALIWDMVMGYKRREIGEAEYTRRYHALLDKVLVETWRWLYSQAAEGGGVTVLCYCRDGWFCHTQLMIDYACQKYPKAFNKR